MRSLPPVCTPIKIRNIGVAFFAIFGSAQNKKFAQEIRNYFGVSQVFLLSSGRAALAVLLQAMRKMHPERDEVLIPAYTSFSVPAAVVKADLKVALYDIGPETLSPDMESLKSAINERTLAIIACHLYGYPCDMNSVLATAKEKGVYVIDDAAQAMGAKYNGKYCGTFGDAGIFSLNRGKNITAVEGGIITTNSQKIAEKIKKIKLEKNGFFSSLYILIKALLMFIFFRPIFYWLPTQLSSLRLGESFFSVNFRIKELTNMQACLGSKMLRQLEKINRDRAKKAYELIRALSGVNFPCPLKNAESVFLRLPALCGSDKAQPFLGIVRSYPYPINEIDGLKPYIKTERKEFPGAKILANNILTIPTHSYVTDADIRSITKMLKKNISLKEGKQCLNIFFCL